MAHKYATGKRAFGFCDRCGQRFNLKDMRRIMIKDTLTQIMVCNQDWEPSQPQLQLGRYPVFDPQALRNPRPDISYTQSGLDTNGYPASGSRIFQWGWNPVGGASQFDTPLTPNYLLALGQVGQVTTS
jgi:hypothetical protein